MGILIEAKRIKTGQSLADYETAGVNAINQLKSIKTQIIALKVAINADADFNAEDEVEVQATIDTLLAGIAGI